MKLAIFDIEGTTTSLAFVHDVLFPYARKALPDYLRAHWDDAIVRDAVAKMGVDGDVDQAIAKVGELMDADVKDTGLKILQGLVWQDGYADGSIRGHVYPDVPEAFVGLAARGVQVVIYSSGSVAAQKQIFGCSEAGDLGVHIAGYFDTTTGPKKDAESYRKIVASMGVEPGDATFFTDNLDEANAATAAGLAVKVLTRPGNPPLPPNHGMQTWTDMRPLGDGL